MKRDDLFEGEFRIRAKLGEGGNAVVYAASDERGETVALKILKRNRTGGYDAWVPLRFRAELHAVKQLKSPHTIKLHRHGIAADGTLWVAFELLRGDDLRQVLKQEQTLPPEHAEQILVGVLHSLAEAHRAGVIHRDLKPANIQIERKADGSMHPTVLDFGIARPIGERDISITQTGELVGTPRYMSPEQLTARELTPASDIYALGLILLEMLLGSSALHGGAWGDQLDRLQSGYLLPAGDLSDTNVALHKLVQRMTARDPRDRLGTADAVLEELRSLRFGPTHALDPAVDSPRTQPRWLLPVGIGAVSLLLLGVWFAGNEPEPVKRTVKWEKKREVPGVVADTRPQAPPAKPSPIRTDGCGAEHQPGRKTLSISPPLRQTDVEVYLPENYDPQHRYPMIVLFREGEQDHDGIIAETRLNELANDKNYVLFVPNDDRRDRPWEGAADRVADEIETLALNHLCVDLERVYGVGHARGYLPVSRLDKGGVLKASVASSYRHKVAADIGTPSAPLLFLAPTRDPVNRVDGKKIPETCSQPVLSLPDQVEALKRAHGCTGQRKPERVDDGECTTYKCDVPLRVCKIGGGRHWGTHASDSAGQVKCGGDDTKFPYRAVIGEFLAEFDNAGNQREPGAP